MPKSITDRVTERVALRRVLPEPAERKAIRVTAGLSLQELADAMGVPKSTLTHWEMGTRNPYRKSIAKYAEALNALREAAGAAA